MNSNSRSININNAQSDANALRLVKMTTMLAWIALIIGLVTCLLNITDWSTRNWGLMIGLGFLVGSVFIYVIGTAIGLVDKRAINQSYGTEEIK